MPRPPRDTYDSAQICPNGHVANSRADDYPNHNADRCEKCGLKTIRECQSCHAPIRGAYRDSSGLRAYDKPPYCRSCGEPFPWTQLAKNAAVAYLRETTILSDADIGTIGHSLDELMSDTPMMQVAAVRLNKIVKEAGPVVIEGLKAILFNLLTDPAKKALGW